MATCKAKSKRSGERCKNHALPGREVCRIHGGKTPRGLALPQTKHGRHSKDIPTRLIADYEAALADTELIAVREELAMLVAREADLLRRVDTGEAGEHWGAMMSAWADYKAAHRSGDDTLMASSETRLWAAMDAGSKDYEAWGEYLNVVERRRRLVETERKRLSEIQQAITNERAMMLAAALLDSVKRHVNDRATLAAIGADFHQIYLNAGGGDAHG